MPKDNDSYGRVDMEKEEMKNLLDDIASELDRYFENTERGDILGRVRDLVAVAPKASSKERGEKPA